MGSIRSVVAGAEVGGLDAVSAARLVEECAEAERLLAALRVLATASLQDKGVVAAGGVPVGRGLDGSQDWDGGGDGDPHDGDGRTTRSSAGGG